MAQSTTEDKTRISLYKIVIRVLSQGQSIEHAVAAEFDCAVPILNLVSDLLRALPPIVISDGNRNVGTVVRIAQRTVEIHRDSVDLDHVRNCMDDCDRVRDDDPDAQALLCKLLPTVDTQILHRLVWIVRSGLLLGLAEQLRRDPVALRDG